jgi:hypothetical protein
MDYKGNKSYKKPNSCENLCPNFRAPDPNWKNFSGSPEIKKIQNDSPKFSFIDAISDVSVASDFTTHQQF